MQEIKPEYYREDLKNTQVGDVVFFGAYEQDNNSANGKEDIQWQVLDTQDGKILVISKYALDCKPYNNAYEDITWENCTLRKWLNSDFLNTAFTEEEQKMTPTVTVSADKNPEYSTNPGNATQDKVFLLSIQEVQQYFPSNFDARVCKPTAYAMANNAWESGSGSYWWLRSSGKIQSRAAIVHSKGDIGVHGDKVNIEHNAVRPAMWINLES